MHCQSRGNHANPAANFFLHSSVLIFERLGAVESQPAQTTVLNFSSVISFQPVGSPMFWKGRHPYVTTKSKSLIGQSFTGLTFTVRSVAACFHAELKNRLKFRSRRPFFRLLLKAVTCFQTRLGGGRPAWMWFVEGHKEERLHLEGSQTLDTAVPSLEILVKMPFSKFPLLYFVYHFYCT